jgi:hypothetical protein
MITDPSCLRDIFMSVSHRYLPHGVKDHSPNLPDALFSHENFHRNSTNGLQRRARKCLLALTTFVFALSTANWILSVVVAFASLDSFGSAVTGCFGSDAVSCIIPKTKSLTQVSHWAAMLGNIAYINVSTVLCRVPTEYPHLIHKHSS